MRADRGCAVGSRRRVRCKIAVLRLCHCQSPVFGHGEIVTFAKCHKLFGSCARQMPSHRFTCSFNFIFVFASFWLFL